MHVLPVAEVAMPMILGGQFIPMLAQRISASILVVRN